MMACQGLVQRILVMSRAHSNRLVQNGCMRGEHAADQSSFHSGFWPAKTSFSQTAQSLALTLSTAINPVSITCRVLDKLIGNVLGIGPRVCITACLNSCKSLHPSAWHSWCAEPPGPAL